MNNPGLVTHLSQNGLPDTRTRLIAALSLRGMDIIARVDHAEAAKRVGMFLNPTEVFIFGNPRVGTPLMNAEQTIGLDLPLKILIWQNSEEAIFLTYNDPRWLCKHHGLALETESIASAMAQALEAIVIEAASPPA